MQVDRLILGDFQTNSYVARRDDSAADCLVVDTGLDTDEPVDFLAGHGLHPTAVVLTHGHADHIVGLEALRERFDGLKVYIHRLDADLLTDPETNLSVLAGARFSTAPADVLLDDGDVIEEAGIILKVLHTPGHTPGGVCLYAEQQGLVFSGDTLFADSVGRTDFPGGSMRALVESIRSKLLVLPDETVVYPGHGMRTTVGRERRSNPFLMQEM
jgi:glyoxylase-like metal-dependent hydrolase (beta-lactamase superfamily II)